MSGKMFKKGLHDLKKHENLLNNKQSLSIAHAPMYKTIMAIGPTGFGKSLVCNRLIGVKDSVDDIVDNTLDEKKSYDQLVSSGADVCTQKLTKTHFWQHCIVIITGCDYYNANKEVRIKKRLSRVKDNIRNNLWHIANCDKNVINLSVYQCLHLEKTILFIL